MTRTTMAFLGLVVLATAAWVQAGAAAPTFGDDVAFLKKHTDAIVLSDKTGQAQVVVVPLYQGRVMTSAAAGGEGLSFGWMNRKLVASGERLKGMNPFGGEDRMWLGPEGGQFSIFFPKGSSEKFDFKEWQTPDCIDWGGWEVVEKSESSAHFRKAISLVNFSGTKLDLVADRTVRLLAPDDVKKHFGIEVPAAVKAVAFESDNSIKNAGEKPWTKETGALSIWILCMFNPSPTTTIAIPYAEGPEDKLGPICNDSYFGKVPAERLKAKGAVVFFMADGKHRGKIGFSPQRAKLILGSYDATNQVLTLATYTRPAGATEYVNSMWEIQKEPFKGDVVNSYNDGPNESGGMLGPFYELESSSPAAFLQPGQSLQHIHRTVHLQGSEEALDPIAKAALGVGLDAIKNAFK